MHCPDRLRIRQNCFNLKVSCSFKVLVLVHDSNKLYIKRKFRISLQAKLLQSPARQSSWVIWHKKYPFTEEAFKWMLRLDLN